MLEQFNSPPPTLSQPKKYQNKQQDQIKHLLYVTFTSEFGLFDHFVLDICPWILQQHAFLGLCRVEKKPNIKSIPFHVNPRVLRTSNPYLTSCKACSIDNEKGKCRARAWEIVYAYLN